MKIRCLIVDDEPLAQRVIEKYISSLPSLELACKCNNALDAAAFLHSNTVDVIFLDIKMPELTGLEFLKTLTKPPKVILTTAFSEYALEGYEYSVVDYLLKPISFERFLKAVNKITGQMESKQEPAAAESQNNKSDFIFLREDKIDHKVLFSDILYVEGCGNFVKVFANRKMIMVAETMTHIEEKLPGNIFLRVHKSFIVSIRKISKIIFKAHKCMYII